MSERAHAPSAAQFAPGRQHLVRATLLLLLVAAFALRAWRLDYQSFWSDEGISLNRAALPLAEMMAQMPVEHAPAYFVALHAWRAFTGDADFALRFFSLIPGVLTVALAFRFAVELAHPHFVAARVALLAAALTATSAFLVWYAQEARMYAWLIAAALTSAWALWRILLKPERRPGFAALYALSTAACVYLHYYGAFLAIAQALYVAGGTIATRRWRPALWWLGAAAAAFLLFLPWLPRALGVTAFGGWRTAGDVAAIPLTFARAYLSIPVMPTSLPWYAWLSAALALLGLLWWLVVRPAAGWLIAAQMLGPLAAVILLALRNPDFHERYTSYLAPFLLVCVAAGAAALDPAAWQAPARARPGRFGWVAPVVIAALLLGGSLAATWRQATDVSLHKPDYRAAAQQIEASQQPGDVILVDGPNPELVFLHYYEGGLPVIDLRDLEGKDDVAIDARLREVTATASRAWEVLFFHPPAAVQVWLATRGWAALPTEHNGIRVTPYGLAHEADAATAQDLDVGPALRLVESAVAPQSIRAGDLVRVTTNWFTLATPPDYKFSLRVLDAAGNVVDSQDYVPQNWFAPTSIWVVGAEARDQRGIATPSTLAPGDYRVTLRVYDSATGVPATTAAGDDIPLGGFTVEAL